MEWGSPGNFIWFWLALLAAGFFALNGWRRRSALARFGEPELVARLAGSLSYFTRFLKKALLLLVIVLMVLALAQPHFRKKETLVERKGIDIMIAVDVSNSMLAKDIAPNRLEKAKLELSTLIEKLKGNRLGVVAFAGDAMIQCPLTLDQNAVKLFLSTVSPSLISYQGTSLARAIQVSQQAFAEKEKEYKAIILLTDGENHEPDAETAATRASKEGIRIFTIGIGTPDGSILPTGYPGGGNKKDGGGRIVISKLNESLLKEIARRTGGAYFRSTRGEFEVDALVREVNAMKQKGFNSEWSVEYEENYQFFLILAFALLLIEMFLSERKRSGL